MSLLNVGLATGGSYWSLSIRERGRGDFFLQKWATTHKYNIPRWGICFQISLVFWEPEAFFRSLFVVYRLETNKQTQTFTSNLIRTVPFSASLMSVIRREDRAKKTKKQTNKNKKEMRKSLNGRKVIRSSVLSEYFLTHLINI